VTRYLVSRIVAIIPIALVVSLAVFVVFQLLPGTVVDTLTGESGGDASSRTALRRELGLDKPPVERYLDWMSHVAMGDLGRSPVLRQDVVDAIRQRIQPTLQLGVAAWLLAIVIAIPAGVISATKRGSWVDTVVTLLAVGGVAMPSFWMGILFVLLFSIKLDLLPPSGYVPFAEDPAESLKLLILPALTISLHLSASLMRQVRSSMLETLSQDYIRTARAKGLTEFSVVMRHGLRNALLPVLTVAGAQVGLLFSGVVVVEQVFAVPGMGRLAVDSTFARDYVTVQGIVLMMAMIVLLANLVTDLLYAAADPRIRY
jgi:peptide/nickel transport system permease protein